MKRFACGLTDIAGAVEYTGLSVGAIRRLCAKRLLDDYRLNRTNYRFRIEALDLYLHAHFVRSRGST